MKLLLPHYGLREVIIGIDSLKKPLSKLSFLRKHLVHASFIACNCFHVPKVNDARGEINKSDTKNNLM